jgi:hypothetical protein
MKNTNDSMDRPISPVERIKLMKVCTELGIDMARYPIDRDLRNAITAAVLAEVASEDAPELGFYEI